MTMFRSCPVPLTNEEQRQKGATLAGLENELAKVEDEKKIAVAGFGASIKALKNQISAVALIVRSKEEFRDVRCYETKDYKACVVRLFREDTERLVEERAMLSHEHQADLEEVTGPEQGDIEGGDGEAQEPPEVGDVAPLAAVPDPTEDQGGEPEDEAVTPGPNMNPGADDDLPGPDVDPEDDSDCAPFGSVPGEMDADEPEEEE